MTCSSCAFARGVILRWRTPHDRRKSHHALLRNGPSLSDCFRLAKHSKPCLNPKKHCLSAVTLQQTDVTWLALVHLDVCDDMVQTVVLAPLAATGDMTTLHDAPVIISTGSSTIITVNTPECGFILNTQSYIDAFLCHIGCVTHFRPCHPLPSTFKLCERHIVNVGVTSQSRAPTNQHYGTSNNAS